MSEGIAKLLREELHRATDVSKLVDCVLEVFSCDSRCWGELIRKLEPTPDVPIPLSLVATSTTSVSEHGSDARDVTADPTTSTPNTERPTTRSSLAHGKDKPASNAEAECVVERKRPRARDDTIDRRVVRKRSPAPLPTTPPSKRGQTSTRAPPAKAKPKVRGPGRKQKTLVPDFNEERFANIFEPLRREISEYTLVNGLQDAWRVVDALRWPDPEAANLDKSLSRVQRLQWQFQHCDTLDTKDYSLPTLTVIQRRFYMVQLMAEYRNATREEHNGDGSGVIKTFQREMFPELGSQQRQKRWDYFNRTAEPLFQAVQRYGYGVLIFPLRNVTMKSLQRLRRESISDLLDYMRMCHPAVDIVLNNTSVLLATLLTWGLPPARIPISGVAYEDLMDSKDSPCTNLFMLSGIANYESPVVLGEIPPWPYPLTDNDFEDAALVQEEGCSTGWQVPEDSTLFSLKGLGNV
ncbi:hypothetical protein BB8028_0005g11510 [Beauveria bassiana]|uniref:Uncharacterized protein n=1 Tax=Beauveria bassiana TaxID=176275 RepID=A0A2S7YI56_BEABA|nr:hypothetical protein BB8028_0005g11510 [Beauveria bassiana]